MSIPYPSRYSIDTKEDFYRNRCWQLNEDFEWTAENKKRAAVIINAITKRLEELYHAVAAVKAEYDKDIALGNKTFANYEIEGSVYYTSQNARPFASPADTMLQGIFTMCTCSIRTNSVTPLETMEEEVYGSNGINLGLNWNIELFDSFRDAPEIFISYFAHQFFNDSDTFSFHEMLYMRAEDFKINIEATFYESDEWMPNYKKSS